MSDSEDDDRARSWTPPLAQVHQGLSRIEWELRPQGFAFLRQRPPVHSRVGDEQDHVLDGGVVSKLAGDLTLRRLEVTQPCFRLDRIQAARPVDHRIPRSRVALAVQRNLEAPGELGSDSRAQPLQESDLPDIADRVTIGIEAKAWLEADGGAQAADLFEP